MEPEKKQTSTTLVLEKEVEKPSSEKLIIEPALSPKLDSLIKQKFKSVDEQKVKINLTSKNQVFNTQEVKVENLDVVIEDTSKDIEPLYQNCDCLEDNINNEEVTVAKPKKSKKFRMKLVLCVYALICSTFIGWTIGNAIAIHNQGIMLETKSAEYYVNLASYTTKIKGLDGILDEEQKPNSLNPIQAQTTVVPEDMVPPQEYTKQTNWFDNICNWLSNLFRR